jgi:hypothetical protein
LCGLYLPITLIGALVTPPMVMLIITATAAAGAVVDETVDADAADRVVALSAVPVRERSDDAGVRAGARPIVSPRRSAS